jgi:hypothetical protein
VVTFFYSNESGHNTKAVDIHRKLLFADSTTQVPETRDPGEEERFGF